MALIKRADAQGRSHRQVTLDLGDLARRAEIMREAATAEASRIIAEAQDERRRILAGAEEEGQARGFAAGREAGLAAGREAGHREALVESRERVAESERTWSGLIADFERRREGLLVESRRAVVELAVAIAEKVVHRKIEIDPGVVEDQLREMLALVARPSTLVVRIHPDDEGLAREVLPSLLEGLVAGVHVRLAPDPAVGRGSCAARTLGGASIDATVRTQLERLVRDLLPDGREPAP